MTAVALQQRVRPHQRKTVEVLLDVLHRHSPAPDVVALFAVSSKLTAMNVSVAVGAFRARVAEHQVAVALAAGYPFVHAAQWELGLVVVKLGHVANRFPSGKGVAVLTRQGEITVRTACGGAGWALRLRRGVCRLLRWNPACRTHQKPNHQVDQQCRAQGISLVLLVSHETQLPPNVAINWPPRVAEKRTGRKITKGELEICSDGRQTDVLNSRGVHAIHFPVHFFQ